MISSRPQSASAHSFTSMKNPGELFPPDPLVTAAGVTPGSLNDEHMVRALVTQVIKGCGLSRPQIADEMTVLVGEKITVRMLNSYTSEAAEQHRWPAQYTRAFCKVTGDNRLLCCITTAAGFRVIDASEEKLLELGRQIIAQKRAAAEITRLERELAEVAL